MTAMEITSNFSFDPEQEARDLAVQRQLHLQAVAAHEQQRRELLAQVVADAASRAVLAGLSPEEIAVAVLQALNRPIPTGRTNGFYLRPRS